ncbi:MAG: helix-hairpin-helix domain-containing protein, partial [Chlamydiales bacterium]
MMCSDERKNPVFYIEGDLPTSFPHSIETPHMNQIFGYIERITFHNEENGFMVARLKEPRKSELTTIVGTLDLQPGMSVRLLGDWAHNPSHGMQFVVQECYAEEPADVIGIQKYLESGMVRGIGPTYAERIVKKFREKTLEVIDKNPEALLDIKGIGEKRIQTIKGCWKEHRMIRDVMLFLQKYGVPSALAHKLVKLYGEETVARLQENPFTLAQEIRGVGFKTADTIAAKMGFPKESSMRLDSGIEHVFNELASEGHTCFPLPDFLARAKEILGVDVEARIQHLAQEKQIVIEENMLWSKVLYMTEKGIAHQLKRIQSCASKLRSIDTKKALDWVEKILHIALAEKQKEAVASALCEKILVITGGPGTGKSTITRAILTITEKLTRQMILAAPT